MAKEKKRGFFSWLGFGRDEEKNAEPAEQKETTDAAAESEAPAAPQPVAEDTATESVTAAEPAPQEAEPVPAQPEAKEHEESVVTAGEAVAEPAPQEAEPVPELPEATEHEESVVTAGEAVAEPAPQEAEPVPELPEVTEHEEAVVVAEDTAAESARPAEEEIAPVVPVVDESEKEALSEPVQPEILPEDAQSELSSVPVPSAVTGGEHTAAPLPPLTASPYPEPVTEEQTASPQITRQPELIETAGEILPAEAQNSPEESPENTPETAIITEQERPAREGFFARLKRSLVKTKQNLGSGFIGLFRGKKIDDDLFEELEEQLLIADVGVDTTRKIISNLTAHASRKQLRDAEALYGLLKDEMSAILDKVEQPLNIEGKTPFVILMVGVNGVGKTTTIGKLARQYQAEGKSVMLAAGDTFRAAAVEQLEVWGQRNNIPVVAQHTGADSASVIFDAIQAAKARGIDVLIADTAGRLQNKSHLMEELKKITRVMGKLDDSAPHEVMLTIDASTGQNAVSQTKLFNEAVGLTGITLTKLDGTAKGGVIFSVADQFGIPIRYIGVGEGIDDLRPFKAGDFIEALFARED